MLTQPTSTPISDELVKAMEQARNNVSLLEAESGRFERLILSQKRELVSLNGAIKDTQNNLDGLLAKVSEVVKEIAILGEAKSNLLADVSGIELSNTQMRAKIAQQQEELANKANTLDDKEKTLLGREFATSERTKALEASEFILKEKEGLIRELLTKL